MDISKVKFNYDLQEYFAEGQKEALPLQEDWDFPCPKCTCPAKEDYVTCYAEHHTCLNTKECGHSFKVS